MPRIEVQISKSYSDSSEADSTSQTLSPSVLSTNNMMGPELMEDTRYALETGNISRFKDLVDSNIKDFNFAYVFSDQLSLPMILIQTYKKMELGKQQEINIDDYCHCMKWLVRKGANANHQDSCKRSVVHWCILTQCPESLLFATLDTGADPKLQDSEGQTPVHLCIRMACAATLDSILQHVKDKSILETTSNLSGATPLIYAVQISSYDFVRQLVGYNVNINCREANKYQRTALHYAIYVGRCDIFEFLLRKGARTDITDYKGKSVENRADEHPNATFKKMIQVYSRVSLDEDMSSEFHPTTPLMVACQNGEYDSAQLLVDNEADITAVDDGGKNALHYCAESEETTCAELLLERNVDLLSKRDADGYTPLHLATIAGNVKLMHILLQYGADVNCLDNEKHSPVHWAVVCGQADSLKTLIEHKARVAMPDIFGAYPLHYAAQICASQEEGAKDDKIGLKILDMLIAKKTRIDCLDFEKRTPLLWAASMGSVPACEKLIKSGAKVHHGDRAGLTALHCAASRGHDAIINLLVTKYAADVNQGDKNECTPIFYAVTLNQEKCVETLIDLEANIDLQDKKGRTIAHCAASRNLLEILKMLSVKGANMWLPNAVGDLPLHEAVQNNWVDAVKFLAADPNATLAAVNHKEQTALHIAAFKNQVQMVNAILRYNNDIVNQRTESDQGNSVTILDLTTSSECKDFIQRYAGQKAHDLDGTAPYPDRQTITIATPFLKNNRSPRKISVNTKPYAEAIRKAEEIMQLREQNEEAQSDHRGSSRRSSLASIREDDPLMSSSRRPSKLELPVINEKRDAETLTEQKGLSQVSVRATSTTDLRKDIVDSQSQSRSQSKLQVEVPPVLDKPDGVVHDDAGSVASSGSISLPDLFDEDGQMDLVHRIHLNKKHKVPFFWEKKNESPAQAMKLKKPKTSHEVIHRSVEEYERLKQESRRVHDSKRLQLREGAYSDRIILRLLLEEYRRYCMQEYDYDEAGYDDSDSERGAKPVKSKKNRSKSEDDGKSTSSGSKTSKSSTKRSPNKQDDDGEKEPHKKSTKKKNRKEDPEFEAILKETKNLYQQVQKQADETLKLARKMNEVMTQDYSMQKEHTKKQRSASQSKSLMKREPTMNGSSTARTTQSQSPPQKHRSHHVHHYEHHHTRDSPKLNSSPEAFPNNPTSQAVQRPKTGRTKREDQIIRAYTSMPVIPSEEKSLQKLAPLEPIGYQNSGSYSSRKTITKIPT